MRATVPAILLAPGVSGGSTHGMMAARAKTSSIGGPSAANQFQQQNMANQQNTLQQSPGAQLDAANRHGESRSSATSGVGNGYGECTGGGSRTRTGRNWSGTGTSSGAAFNSDHRTKRCSLA